MHKLKPKRARMQLSRHLTVRDVAVLLGEVARATGEPTGVDLQRVRRRLRRVEQEMGVRLLFGGGKGGRGGGRCWTTLNALRHAGLLDDFTVLFQEVGEQVNELHELFDGLDERVLEDRRDIRSIKRQVSAITDALLDVVEG